jgi:hypothetical protein
MRFLCILLVVCLPVAAGSISVQVSVNGSLQGCHQSDTNTPPELEASAACSAYGATASASQDLWSASVSANRNSDWRESVTSSAQLSYSDSLIVVGDSGSGFIQLGHWTRVLGTAWFSYSFAGQTLGLSDPTWIPVTFGVPFEVHWQLNTLGGCSGDGTCTSGFAKTTLAVFSIQREDGTASTGRLVTVDGVPEPSTMMLMVAGLAAIPSLRGRNRAGWRAAGR